MKYLLVTAWLLLLTFTSSAQIKIPDVGNGWKAKVDSALAVIKKYDSKKYKLIIEVCDEVEYWNGDFATTGKRSIVIPTSELRTGIINDLAAILVHESLHLYYAQNDMRMDVLIEETNCYYYEFTFLSKVPNVEPWLLKNAANHGIKTKF